MRADLCDEAESLMFADLWDEAESLIFADLGDEADNMDHRCLLICGMKQNR
jgi:hypothetical protein